MIRGQERGPRYTVHSSPLTTDPCNKVGWRVQPDLGRLRDPLHRPRRRFLHPVHRALPVRALRAGRGSGGAARCRSEGRRAPGAGRGRHDVRVLLVRADGLPRHRRARHDHRVRHDGRVRHHRHAAPGSADRLWCARRAGPDGLCRARAGRPISGPAPHCRGRGNHHRRAGRLAAAVANALRLRSDPPAGPGG